MFVIVGSVLLAIFVVPAPWGQLLVGGALVWEVVEKLLLLWYSKRMPPAIGREALIGLPVTAVSACLPEGWVKLGGERWKARCSESPTPAPSLQRAFQRSPPSLTQPSGRQAETAVTGKPISASRPIAGGIRLLYQSKNSFSTTSQRSAPPTRSWPHGAGTTKMASKTEPTMTNMPCAA